MSRIEPKCDTHLRHRVSCCGAINCLTAFVHLLGDDSVKIRIGHERDGAVSVQDDTFRGTVLPWKRSRRRGKYSFWRQGCEARSRQVEPIVVTLGVRVAKAKTWKRGDVDNVWSKLQKRCWHAPVVSLGV